MRVHCGFYQCRHARKGQRRNVNANAIRKKVTDRQVSRRIVQSRPRATLNRFTRGRPGPERKTRRPFTTFVAIRRLFQAGKGKS